MSFRVPCRGADTDLNAGNCCCTRAPGAKEEEEPLHDSLSGRSVCFFLAGDFSLSTETILRSLATPTTTPPGAILNTRRSWTREGAGFGGGSLAVSPLVREGRGQGSKCRTALRFRDDPSTQTRIWLPGYSADGLGVPIFVSFFLCSREFVLE